MYYLKTFTKKLKQSSIRLLVLILALSVAVPTELLQTLDFSNTKDSSVVHGAAVGGNGSTKSGGDGGAGTGGILIPSGFKVSILGAETPTDRYLVDEKHGEPNFIANNINNHPYSTGGQFFLNRTFDSDKTVSFGWYSNQELVWMGGDLGKITCLSLTGASSPVNGGCSGQPGNIFYDEIKNKLTNDADNFIRGGWRDLLAKAESKKSLCKDNWNYLLGNEDGSGSASYDVVNRFNAVFENNNKWNNMSEWKDDKAKIIEEKAEYIDMLLQYWALCSPSSTDPVRSRVESVIDTILKDEVADRSFALLIEPAAIITNCPNADYVVCTTTDILQTYFNVDNAYNIMQYPNFKAEGLSGSYYGMLKSSVNKSLAAAPNLWRISNQRVENGVNGSIWRGVTGLTRGFYNTYYGSFQKSTYAGNEANIHEVVWVQPNKSGTEQYGTQYGANFVYYVNAVAMDAYIGKLKATPDDHMVDTKATGDKLGENVLLQMYSGIDTAKEKAAWDNIFKKCQEDSGFSGFTITAPLTRTCSYAPYSGMQGNYTVDWSQPIQVSLGALKSAIEGGTTILPDTHDLVADYHVSAEDAEYKIVFEYFADITVKATIGGTPYEWKYNTRDDVEDPASFIIMMEEPERLRYISTPEAYAELKNYGKGSNQSGTLVEEWEVMAGIPTTEQLYFAAGGSEFVVDVSFEHSKNKKAIRSYTSFIEGIECEYHGVGKDGMPTKTTGSYSGSGSLPGGTAPGNWSASSGDTSIVCGCCVCGGGGDWEVTVTCNYTNEYTEVACSTGEHKYIVNGSANYGAMAAKVSEIQSKMNADAEKFTHGASSDGQTRWGASFSWESPSHSAPDGQPGAKCSNTGTHSCDGQHPAPCNCSLGEGESCTTKHVQSCGAFSCSRGSVGTGSFTLRGTWPKHHICGPCCSHHLPDIFDTWSQSWEYDTFNITDIHVWRIDQAAASDLSDVIGPGVDEQVNYERGPVSGTLGAYENPNGLEDGIVGAYIKTQAPNIFFNIAMRNSNMLPGHNDELTYLTQDGIGNATESSAVGRVRYSVDPGQHDMVYYNLGQRTNTCDGMAKTYDNNDIRAGGGGHNEEWGGGFIYTGHAGSAQHHGHDSPSVNPSDVKCSPSEGGQYNVLTPGGNSPKNATTNFWGGSQWNQAGQTNYPLNDVYYLQEHTDGNDGSDSLINTSAQYPEPSTGNNDKATPEYGWLLEKRNQPIEATLVTDFLILQTTSGDQSVLYYETKSPTTGYYADSSNIQYPQFEIEVIDAETDSSRVIPAEIPGDAIAAGITVEMQIPTIEKVREDFWDNNSLSCSSWAPDEINVGGYNGKYSTPSLKFKGTGNGQKIKTYYDRDPAGTVRRPTRPTRRLMIYSLPLNIITEIDNQNYLTYGMDSEVFWTNNIHWTDTSARSLSVSSDPFPPFYPMNQKVHDTEFDFSNNEYLITMWSEKEADTNNSYQGYVQDAYYSKNHSIELNPLIIQDPVSSVPASLISLPDERDQRYRDTLGADYMAGLLTGNMFCPRTVDGCDNAVLNCEFAKVADLASYYFNNNSAENSITKQKLSLTSGYTVSNNRLNGTTGASRIALGFASELGFTYAAGINLGIKAKVNLSSLPKNTDSSTGVLKSRISQMLFSVAEYGLYVSHEGKIGFITKNGEYRESNNITLSTNTEYNIEATMSFMSLDDCEIKVNGTEVTFTSSALDFNQFTDSNIGDTLYIGSMKDNSYGLRGYMDNIEIKRLAGNFSHTDACYVMVATHPNGQNVHVHSIECMASSDSNGGATPVDESFGYTGGMQSITLKPGVYTLEAWGAQGGSTGSYVGGSGGYSTGTLTLDTEQTLYIFVGGQGGSSGTGGYNGGGGAESYAGGGGMTHISTTNNPAKKSTTTSTTKTVSYSGTGYANASYDIVHSFTANTSGTVTFYSNGYTKDPRGVIRINGSVVIDDDDSGSNLDFKASASYSTGDFVELITYRYGSSGSGNCNWYCNYTTKVTDTSSSSSWSKSGTLIAAGGGGGAAHTGVGGAGGGTSGGAGESASGTYGAGGTQSSAGYNGGAGCGGNGIRHGGGGGGGYYGGGGGGNDCDDGGGGGSGYIGGVTNGTMTSGVRTGNGAVRITGTAGKPEGYEYYKSAFESGDLTTSQLKQLFGTTYNDLFSAASYYRYYNNFTNANKFNTFENCDVKAYSGTLLESVTGTSPSFVMNETIDTSVTDQLTLVVDNKTASKTAKIYWSSDGTFTDDNSVSTKLEANKNNQKINFYLGSKVGWTGTVNKFKICIPGDDTKNYGGSVVIKSIGFEYCTPSIGRYTYNGDVQTYTATVSGYYLFEAWGASGLNSTASASAGGKGGYTSGVMQLNSGDKVYVYVGGQGKSSNSLNTGGGWNGGGHGGPGGSGGGGMTHFSTVGTDSFTSTVTTTQTPLYNAGTVIKNFDFTGGIQQITLPAGTYKLEVWGAQGGASPHGAGVGLGGYSSGEVTLNTSTTLYVVVGGQGLVTSGGYNGGGPSAASSDSAYGGGASHIATASGELRNLSSNKSSILLVAGGGGAGGCNGYSGGAGGGANQNGQNGQGSGSYGSPGPGGTTTGVGAQMSGTYAAGFGYGGYSSSLYNSGGGGGGYYGGQAGNNVSGGGASGGGGSGYAASSLSNVSGTTGTRSGNGYARITAVSTVMKDTTSVVANANFSTGAVIAVAGGGGGTDNPGGTAGGSDDGSGGYGGGSTAGNGRVNGANGSGGNTAPNPINAPSEATPYCWIQTNSSCSYENRYYYSDSSTSCTYHCSGWVRAPMYDFSIGALGGTQTSGYKHGMGESATTSTDTGGGGGGYYGGLASNNSNGGAGGGSGYIGKLSSYTASNGEVYTAKTIAGNATMPKPTGGTMVGNSGNGYAKITFIEYSTSEFPTKEAIYEVIDRLPGNSPLIACDGAPNTHVCDKDCREVKTLKCIEPHHLGNHYDANDLCYDPCMDDAKHKPNTADKVSDGTFTPGNFINLDWEFKCYYANTGDFYQSNLHGLSSLTNTRGMSYVNNMDTVKWIREKRIRFEFNAIYEDKLYLAGEWITLAAKGDYRGVDGSPYDERNWTNYDKNIYNNLWGNEINGSRNYRYQFYCVEGNSEHRASITEVENFGINNERYVPDNGRKSAFASNVTNKHRTSKKNTSNHSSYNQFPIDVVGRIGNFAVIDTGDYRFSNFFKQPISNDTVIPDPTVYTVADKFVLPTGGASKTSTQVIGDEAGQGAVLKNLNLTQGTYRLYVVGTGLSDTMIKVVTNSSWDAVTTADGYGLTVKNIDGDPDTVIDNPKLPSVEISGPGITLEPGIYKMTVSGDNLDNADWRFQDGTVDRTSFITNKTIKSGEITVIFDAKSKIYDLQFNGRRTGAHDVSVDSISIMKFNDSSSTDLAQTSAVTNIAISDTARTYNLVVDYDMMVDISVLSSGLPMSVTSIATQQVATANYNWLVDGLVKKVNMGAQLNYLTWEKEIRGLPISRDTQYIDTYGTMLWPQTAIMNLTLPLDSSQNNIAILRDDAMLIGYDVYASIHTIGDYWRNGGGFLQIIPEWYAVNIKTKVIEPVDAHIFYNNAYYPVNIWGLVTGEDKYTWGGSGSGLTIDNIYNFVVALDWSDEEERRMVSAPEEYMTAKLKDWYYTDRPLDTPSSDKYIMGNAQFMQLSGKARTFIGGETTYGTLLNYSPSGRYASHIFKDPTTGVLYNPSGKVDAQIWWKECQRWHMTITLPSSAVLVRSGVNPTLEEIARYKTEDWVFLSTVDMRVLGEVWNLKYESTNGAIEVIGADGNEYVVDIPEYLNVNGHMHKIPTCVAVYQTQDTTPDDIDITSNH